MKLQDWTHITGIQPTSPNHQGVVSLVAGEMTEARKFLYLLTDYTVFNTRLAVVYLRPRETIAEEQKLRDIQTLARAICEAHPRAVENLAGFLYHYCDQEHSYGPFTLQEGLESWAFQNVK